MRDRDFTSIARRVVEQAIGEHLDGSPLQDPNAGKDARAVARGRLGGLRGGPNRATALSAKERKRIAKRAAKARWGKSS